MTLCIAATCTHEDTPAIVLCSDWRAESGDLAGGDVEDKLSWIIPKRWAALKAGSICEADRLASVYQTVFESMPEALTRTAVMPLMERAFQSYRQLLANNYVTTTLGLDYMALLSGVKLDLDSEPIELPESLVDKTLNEIAALPYPDGELIIAGFVENGVPVMCAINQNPPFNSFDRVRPESNFCAIGSGASAALASLYRREHTGSEIDLTKAVYHAYEAKVIGEVSPGVGDATSITVLFPNGDCWDLSSKGHKYMLERFDYFGPMKIGKRTRKPLKSPWFSFDPAHFQPYEAPWERWGYPSSPTNSSNPQT